MNGRNEFYRLYKTAQDDPEWFTMNLRASSSGIIFPKELAALKRDMPECDYEQEYENDFDVAGRGNP